MYCFALSVLFLFFLSFFAQFFRPVCFEFRPFCVAVFLPFFPAQFGRVFPRSFPGLFPPSVSKFVPANLSKLFTPFRKVFRPVFPVLLSVGPASKFVFRPTFRLLALPARVVLRQFFPASQAPLPAGVAAFLRAEDIAKRHVAIVSSSESFLPPLMFRSLPTPSELSSPQSV